MLFYIEFSQNLRIRLNFPLDGGGNIFLALRTIYLNFSFCVFRALLDFKNLFYDMLRIRIALNMVNNLFCFFTHGKPLRLGDSLKEENERQNASLSKLTASGSHANLGY